METLETKQEGELIDALFDAYNTLAELYSPLQIKQIKSKVDSSFSGYGLPNDEIEENDWSDRAIIAIEYVEKKREEYLKSLSNKK